LFLFFEFSNSSCWTSRIKSTTRNKKASR
jgi:hypothetical protein